MALFTRKKKQLKKAQNSAQPGLASYNPLPQFATSSTADNPYAYGPNQQNASYQYNTSTNAGPVYSPAPTQSFGVAQPSVSYTSGGSTGEGTFNFNMGSIGGAQQGLAQQINLLSSPEAQSGNFTDLEAALRKNKDDYSAYYDELRKLKSRGFEDYLKQTQQGLDMTLSDLEQGFTEDRLAADINEAQSGTLFSTGRRERRQSMQDKYQRQADSARLRAESNLRDQARQFEYDLGSDALGDYNLRLGSSSFDAGGTRPTTSRRLTRAYRPEGYVGSLNEQERINMLNQGGQTFNERIRRNLPGNY